ncbi:MAG: 50S ribosomal protein L6 [Nanobdellota archaeon]
MASEPAFKEQITLPEGVNASYQNGILTVSGEKGEISRELVHPKVTVETGKDDEGNEAMLLIAPIFTLREKKISRTFRAHMRNMFKGVTEGHEYKLKICSGHFPMNVSVKGSTLEVKNFFGEAVPRTYTFDNNVDVKVDGESITVNGINKELVAQTAASIERMTKRSGFDKKVFQDGIYIVEKDGKAV